MFIRAMVRIFSFGERWNVPFNSAVASLNRTFHLSPHENILTIACTHKHSLFVYYFILFPFYSVLYNPILFSVVLFPYSILYHLFLRK
jgi:hypothetical protein